MTCSEDLDLVKEVLVLLEDRDKTKLILNQISNLREEIIKDKILAGKMLKQAITIDLPTIIIIREEEIQIDL